MPLQLICSPGFSGCRSYIMVNPQSWRFPSAASQKILGVLIKVCARVLLLAPAQNLFTLLAVSLSSVQPRSKPGRYFPRSGTGTCARHLLLRSAHKAAEEGGTRNALQLDEFCASDAWDDSSCSGIRSGVAQCYTIPPGLSHYCGRICSALG